MELLDLAEVAELSLGIFLVLTRLGLGLGLGLNSGLVSGIWVALFCVIIGDSMQEEDEEEEQGDEYFFFIVSSASVGDSLSWFLTL